VHRAPHNLPCVPRHDALGISCHGNGKASNVSNGEHQRSGKRDDDSADKGGIDRFIDNGDLVCDPAAAVGWPGCEVKPWEQGQPDAPFSNLMLPLPTAMEATAQKATEEVDVLIMNVERHLLQHQLPQGWTPGEQPASRPERNKMETGER
jgi:hypothetical protein